LCTTLSRKCFTTPLPVMADSPYYNASPYSHPLPPQQQSQPSQNQTPSLPSNDYPQAAKKKRISRACDFCHDRSTKCRQNPEGGSCLVCLEFQQPCTYNRPEKKRGIPRKTYRPPDVVGNGNGNGDEMMGVMRDNEGGGDERQRSTGAVTNGTTHPAPIGLSKNGQSSEMSLDLLERAQNHDPPSNGNMNGISQPSATQRAIEMITNNEKRFNDLIELYFGHVQPLYAVHPPSHHVHANSTDILTSTTQRSRRNWQMRPSRLTSNT
jgi:hypothetical protein